MGAVGVALLATGSATGWPLYVAVLACVGVDRFLLAALSAGLPHVVGHPRPGHRELPDAHGRAPSAYGVGAGVTFVLRLLDALEPRAAARVGRAARRRVRRWPCGSGRTTSVRTASCRSPRAGAASPRGLAQGVRHVWERRGPAYALGAVGADRFVYGVVTIASILLCRNTLTDPSDTKAGLALLSVVVAVVGRPGSWPRPS